MAKNDAILLDGIIDQRLLEKLPSEERDEVFEFFVLEELLKDYDLSREEIEAGWIDGRGDGGFDGAFILINGHLLEDIEDFVWPRTNASIDVWLVTCKHHPTFSQATLDAILATIQELFDLSCTAGELKGSYSSDLLAFRSLLQITLRRLSIGRPKLTFNIIYASRGDTNDLGESVVARARQIEALIPQLFSSCSAMVRFTGASELVELHRKSKTFSLDLPFLEHLATGKESYVLLTKLEDYWRFVSDENGNLRCYLFDSNVRDYLGQNAVNEDIARSLGDEAAPDFWWLNNGVTILATNATVPGKTIQLQNIQIVNGLQTTETIFRHFQRGSVTSRNRALLVKIIVSSDAQARDRIIQATNNQSPVEIAALHATDKIQRDIEEILERHAWYYERRRNYYRNIGKPLTRFVTPIYLASAAVDLVLKNPAVATRIRSKFMRVQESYDAVFSSKFPIEVWPVLVDVYKSVDAGLTNLFIKHWRRERIVATWRPLVALIVAGRRLKSFAYSPNDLTEVIGKTEITSAEVADAREVIMNVDKHVDQSTKTMVKGPFALTCCNEAAMKFGLSGAETVGKRHIPFTDFFKKFAQIHLTEEFIREVDTLLPSQPWKAGIHLEIASKVGCPPTMVSAVIQKLIADGKRNFQVDGVVFDSKGSVIAVDPERSPRGGRSKDINPLDSRNYGKLSITRMM
jgi:hypothetical protein